MSNSIPRPARRAGPAVIWAALFSFLGAFPTFPEAPIELDSVTVTASRISEGLNEAPPAVSVVTRADIEARGASTIAQALRVVPGLALSDRGAEGSQVAVSLRGSTTNQVLVLMDGVRMNDALTGLVDISSISLESVERIEVMRGGGSSLYGGDAVGGVVNIITKKAAAPLVLRFENGSYMPTARVSGFGFSKAEEDASASSLVDSQKAAFSWGPKAGDATLRLSGSATRAGNAFTFIDNNGEKRVRQNAGLLGADASIGASLGLGGGTLSSDLSGSAHRVGVPGSADSTEPTLRAAETDAAARASVKYSSECFLSDLLSLEAGLHAEYSSIDYVDEDHPADASHHEILTGGMDASQRAYVSDAITLAYGCSLSYATISSGSIGSRDRSLGGLFLESSIALGALSIRPSVRYDYYSDFFEQDGLGGIGAALGATYRVDDADSLKANLSRAYRAPSFSDLYWPRSSGAEGNPDLTPETAYEANVGFERRVSWLEYVATAYLRYTEDVILWQPGTDGYWKPTNFGDAFYPGVELTLKAKVSERYAISGSYSWLHSYVLSGDLDLADDKRLPMTSEHSLKGTLSFAGGRFSWSTTAVYASLRYIKTANVAYLPAYFTLDALVRWKAGEKASVYIAVDNIFDEQYAIVDGYPMPGTKIRLGIELKF
jgi:vitamin B12 transporter